MTMETDHLSASYEAYAHRQVEALALKKVETVPITGIWLRREGGENDVGTVVVLIEVAGAWVEVIREGVAGSYSHICEVGGIRAKQAATS